LPACKYIGSLRHPEKQLLVEYPDLNLWLGIQRKFFEPHRQISVTKAIVFGDNTISHLIVESATGLLTSSGLRNSEPIGGSEKCMRARLDAVADCGSASRKHEQISSIFSKRHWHW
jgi:hypothetical protein